MINQAVINRYRLAAEYPKSSMSLKVVPDCACFLRTIERAVWNINASRTAGRGSVEHVARVHLESGGSVERSFTPNVESREVVHGSLRR